MVMPTCGCVAPALAALSRAAAVLAAQPPDAADVRRMKIVLGSVLIALLGICSLLIIVLVGRYFRRQAGRPLPPTRHDEDDWYRKPLVGPPNSDADAEQRGRDVL